MLTGDNRRPREPVLGLAYNVILIPVAMGVLYPFTGMLLDPIFAAAAMALSSVTVVSNALRLRGFHPSRITSDPPAPGRIVAPNPALIGVPMRRSAHALVPAVALLVAACSSGSGSTPRASAAASSAASASAAATHIEVKLTDALRMEPPAMSVPVGVPVTFVVTNAGSTHHEFYLGDEDAQAGHEQEMVAMGGMKHDEPEGIAVKPGETNELTRTFDTAGKTIAGCHVTGHYSAGMKAEIMVGA
jgi:uncharacterized cupredoxin-like copper-binding protein